MQVDKLRRLILELFGCQVELRLLGVNSLIEVVEGLEERMLYLRWRECKEKEKRKG